MAWIPVVLLFVAACCARIVSKSWLTPSAFSAGIWTVYLALPLAVAPEYNVSPLGPWIIFVMVLALCCGSLLTERIPTTTPIRLANPSRLLKYSLLFSCIAAIGALYFLYQQLASHGLDLEAGSLLLIGRMVYAENDINPPAVVRIAVMWAFPASMLAGMAFAQIANRKKRLLCFAPFVAALIYSLANATKANTFICVILWLSGWIAMRVISGAKPIPFKKLAIRLSAIIALVVLSVGATDMLRSHTEEQALAFSIDIGRLKSYALGYLKCFDFWAEHTEEQIAPSVPVGFNTFGGIYESLGIAHRPPGFYQEFINLDRENVNNIFTAFRGMIQDFTLPGSLVLLVLVGAAAGWAYGKPNAIALPLLAGFYAFLVWSPVISLFLYNSSTLALFVSVGVLALPERAPRKLSFLGWRLKGDLIFVAGLCGVCLVIGGAVFLALR